MAGVALFGASLMLIGGGWMLGVPGAIFSCGLIIFMLAVLGRIVGLLKRPAEG